MPPPSLLQITREAGPVKGGETVIAFAKDPSGYMWELIQRPKTQEPLCQVKGHVCAFAAAFAKSTEYLLTQCPLPLSPINLNSTHIQ